MNRIVRRLALPAALAAAIGATAAAMQSVQDPVTVVDAQVAPAPETAGAEALAQAFRSASRTALAGVVHVQVEAAPRQVRQQFQPFEGTPFEDFFREMPSPGPRNGSGSGFIISPDGYVLTNNHVVESATRVTVTMTDRREFEATVVGRDPNTDVAVLKLDADNLPVVRIGDSDVLEVGDWVLALGYPLSLGETVTAGIVSAKGKNIGIMQQNADASAPLEHFIQTDAAINPGNSGGPLVNLRGEVIGINSAIASTTGLYSGYGFAVPIRLAKRVADDLIRYGEVHRPKLGVSITDVQAVDIDVFDLPSPNGAVVRTVPEGPAKDAGIRVGDVIVGVDGQPIRDSGELLERIALLQPGDRVSLDLIRYGNSTRTTVSLGSFETTSGRTSAPVVAARSRDSVGQLGFAAAELTSSLARQLDVRSNSGVVITQVDPAGPAPQVLARMTIRTINGQEVRSVEDLRAIAGRIGSGNVVSIVAVTPEGEETIVNYRLR